MCMIQNVTFDIILQTDINRLKNNIYDKNNLYE